MNIYALAATVVLVAAPHAALAQPADRIRVNLNVRSEGRPDRDTKAARLLTEVQRGLEAIADVEIGSRDDSRRVVWIVVGAAPAPAASVIVTERYDRETLMVLGIEDEDMAHRMMALQIVVDHQIFTAGTTAQLARRIVSALDTGPFARLRTQMKK